jgi:hypothetical protein
VASAISAVGVAWAPAGVIVSAVSGVPAAAVVLIAVGVFGVLSNRIVIYSRNLRHSLFLATYRTSFFLNHKVQYYIMHNITRGKKSLRYFFQLR